MKRPLRPCLPRWIVFCGLLLCCGALAPAQATAVELELVLAVDASSSVNDQEFRLQMGGIAAAFRHPAVIKAIDASEGVAVSLVQWSGVGVTAQAVGWTVVHSALSVHRLAAEIEAAPRLVAGGATAIGSALLYAAGLLETNEYQGKRLVIDLSGDGVSNEGDLASTARAYAVRQGITVNGLAILNDEPNLGRYYLAGVVGGPGAFVLTASDFRDFALAMRQKLITEITGGTISRLAPAVPDRYAARGETGPSAASAGNRPWSPARSWPRSR